MPAGAGPMSFADVAALAAKIRAEKAAEKTAAANRQEDDSSAGTLRAGMSPFSAVRAAGGAGGLDSPTSPRSPMRDNPRWQFQTSSGGGQPPAAGRMGSTEQPSDGDGLSTIWEAGRRTYSQQHH